MDREDESVDAKSTMTTMETGRNLDSTKSSMDVASLNNLVRSYYRPPYTCLSCHGRCDVVLVTSVSDHACDVVQCSTVVCNAVYDALNFVEFYHYHGHAMDMVSVN